jgi:hypothetical protein
VAVQRVIRIERCEQAREERGISRSQQIVHAIIESSMSFPPRRT